MRSMWVTRAMPPAGVRKKLRSTYPFCSRTAMICFETAPTVLRSLNRSSGSTYDADAAGGGQGKYGRAGVVGSGGGAGAGADMGVGVGAGAAANWTFRSVPIVIKDHIPKNRARATMPANQPHSFFPFVIASDPI